MATAKQQGQCANEQERQKSATYSELLSDRFHCHLSFLQLILTLNRIAFGSVAVELMLPNSANTKLLLGRANAGVFVRLNLTKTEAWEGRTIPLNSSHLPVLREYATWYRNKLLSRLNSKGLRCLVWNPKWPPANKQAPRRTERSCYAGEMKYVSSARVSRIATSPLKATCTC